MHPADVHMEATGFNDADGDTHECSDWEIWASAPSEPVWEAPCASGVLRVHIHLGDGAFINSYAGRTELAFESDYVLRVRFRDSAGESSGWVERAFSTSSAEPPGTPAEVPWEAQSGYQVEIVAGDLQLPVNVAFVSDPGGLPDDPLLYVTELYGRIKVVTQDGTVRDYAHGLLNFNPTGSFPGSGEKGLTGITVDPSTGDVFASLVYEDTSASEDPKPHYAKVVRFHSNDGGLTAASETTVLDMPGEPQGPSHQISNLTIGPDQMLYVHNGDGFDHTTAQNLDSFRGKILRMTLDGAPVPDNPFYDASDGVTARDYVFAYGFRNPFGGAWRAADGGLYEVENGPAVDRFAEVVAGRNYGWDGTDDSMRQFALYTWEPSHAPVNVTFVEHQTASGSGFPADKMDHAFITESGPTYATGPQTRGKRIVEFAFGPTGNLTGPVTFVEYTGSGKATAVGLAPGPDGLYFTDLYKDLDASSPVDRGANLLRVRYVGEPARLQVGLAQIRNRRLTVRGSLNPRAAGERLAVRFRAAGRQIRMRPAVRANGRFRVSRPLRGPQRRARAGRLQVRYAGNGALRAVGARLRAARRAVRLRVNRVRLQGKRLVVAGRVLPRARGQARVQIEFNQPDGSPAQRATRARVNQRGRFSARLQVPPAVRNLGAWVAITHRGRAQLFGQRVGRSVGG